MTRPERYQIGFDFRAEEERPFYEIGPKYPDTQERFVRVLREDIWIRTQVDVVNYLLNHVYNPMERFEQEELWILLLNTKNRITHDVMLYRGTVNMINIRVGEIFKEAIKFNSPALIMVHNHPSGQPDPSPEDVAMSQIVHTAGKLLQIDVLDSIIIAHSGYTSLASQGTLIPPVST